MGWLCRDALETRGKVEVSDLLARRPTSSSADISRNKRECLSVRLGAEWGWFDGGLELNAKHCYIHSMCIFSFNPLYNPAREIFVLN